MEFRKLFWSEKDFVIGLVFLQVSQVQGIGEITEQIRKSNNSFYIFTVILLILCAMFMAGCFCRPYVRYSRVRKYK